jgi:retron-type reverse transcriptase
VGNRHNLFEQLVHLDNLLLAWKEFKRGKMKKVDVDQYSFHLESNIFSLQKRLQTKSWAPDPHDSFYISDPKLRHIHKASVRDRVFNQALFRIIYPIFETTFVHDSYSCRNNKGTHKGVQRLDTFIRQSTQNYTKPVFALKCDIKRFFDSVSHDILLAQLSSKIDDCDIMRILELIIRSFEVTPNTGLPLGNVTSQLFTNVYLNDLDQYVKHTLQEKYYLRYCDDFIILNTDKDRLKCIVNDIEVFLKEKLQLSLHKRKVSITNINQGVDFLGYMVLPHYKVLRTSTKKRMFRNIQKLHKAHADDKISLERLDASLNSYRGILGHYKGHNLSKELDIYSKIDNKMPRE